MSDVLFELLEIWGSMFKSLNWVIDGPDDIIYVIFFYKPKY